MLPLNWRQRIQELNGYLQGSEWILSFQCLMLKTFKHWGKRKQWYEPCSFLSRKTQRQQPKIKRESRQHTTPMTAAAINNTQHRWRRSSRRDAENFSGTGVSFFVSPKIVGGYFNLSFYYFDHHHRAFSCRSGSVLRLTNEHGYDQMYLFYSVFLLFLAKLKDPSSSCSI